MSTLSSQHVGSCGRKIANLMSQTRTITTKRESLLCVKVLCEVVRAPGRTEMRSTQVDGHLETLEGLGKKGPLAVEAARRFKA